MRIILKKGIGSEDLVEKYIKTVPSYIPDKTLSVEKVLGKFYCYDMGMEKVGRISEVEFNELWNMPKEEIKKEYHIPTAEENDEWWESDSE